VKNEERMKNKDTSPLPYPKGGRKASPMRRLEGLPDCFAMLAMTGKNEKNEDVSSLREHLHS
jgi:hypothetical protein